MVVASVTARSSATVGVVTRRSGTAGRVLGAAILNVRIRGVANCRILVVLNVHLVGRSLTSV